MTASLRVEAVSAAYKKRPVIQGVTLTVRRGQAVVLIGPNGAGKSTLLKIVAGFLAQSRGHVSIHGAEVSGLEPHERARLGVGYLMQGGKVFPSLTGAENLALAAVGVASRERAESVREAAETLGLQEVLGERAGTLSGGWRQRLALAMVLVRRPSVLLLDEPSAGLSPALTRGIFEALGRYRRAHGTAMLLAEQNLEAGLGFAQRAVVLVNGRLRAQTKQPGQWLDQGRLNELFRVSEPEDFSRL